MTMPDSIQRLKADLLRDHPEAVDAAILQAADDYLKAAIRFTRLMLEADDAFAGTRALINVLQWQQEAHKRLEKDIIVSRKPTSTMEMFTE